MDGPSLQERYAPDNACFGCGPANPQGLHVRSFVEGDECVAEWKVSVTPNDPKLSDRGVRRGTCMVGGKAAAEAGAVTHGAVRCSAWLDPTANARTILFIRSTEFLPEITLLLFHDAKMQNEQQHAGRDHKPETVG